MCFWFPNEPKALKISVQMACPFMWQFCWNMLLTIGFVRHFMSKKCGMADLLSKILLTVKSDLMSASAFKKWISHCEQKPSAISELTNYANYLTFEVMTENWNIISSILKLKSN